MTRLQKSKAFLKNHLRCCTLISSGFRDKKGFRVVFPLT